MRMRADAALRLRPRRPVGPARRRRARRRRRPGRASGCARPVDLDGRDRTHAARSSRSPPGDSVPFVLTYAASHLPRPRPVDADAGAGRHGVVLDRLDRALHLRRRVGRRRPPVAAHRSRRSPTRRPAASSPPRPRRCPSSSAAPRNWDYRYCWLRDATFTLQALLGTGYVDEARAWREWLLRAVAGDPADLQIMYGLDGTPADPRVRARLAARATRAPPRCGSATPPPTSSSSTCGARCSTACTSPGRRADHRPRTPGTLQRALLDFLEGALGRPGQQPVGGPRDRAALRALQGDGLGRPRPRGAGGRALRPATARWTAGGGCARRSTTTSARTATTPTGTPSPSSTARAAWTPRCCCSPGSASCRRTTRASSAPWTPCSAS